MPPVSTRKKEDAELPAPDQAARRFHFTLLVASLALVGYIAWPLVTPLLLAAVLAVVLAPLQARLRRWLRGRDALAAGLLVLAVLFLVVGPLLGLAAVMVKEAAEGVRFIVDIVRSQGVISRRSTINVNRNPSANDPLTFTTNVPHGKPVRRLLT